MRADLGTDHPRLTICSSTHAPAGPGAPDLLASRRDGRHWRGDRPPGSQRSRTAWVAGAFTWYYPDPDVTFGNWFIGPGLLRCSSKPQTSCPPPRGKKRWLAAFIAPTAPTRIRALTPCLYHLNNDGTAHRDSVCEIDSGLESVQTMATVACRFTLHWLMDCSCTAHSRNDTIHAGFCMTEAGDRGSCRPKP